MPKKKKERRPSTFESRQVRVNNDCIENIKKLHPNKTFTQATKDLNKVLEEMLYGKKKNKN